MGCSIREPRSGRFKFLGPLKVALMLRLSVKYGCCGGGKGSGADGVIDIVVFMVIAASVSMFRREGSARHMSNGDAFCVVNSTCL